MFLTFLIFHQCQDTIVSAVKKSIFQWLISNLRLIILQRLDTIHFLSYLSVAVVDTKLVIHFGKSIPVIVIFTLIGIDHLVGDIHEAVSIGIFALFSHNNTIKRQLAQIKIINADRIFPFIHQIFCIFRIDTVLLQNI